MTDDTDKSGIVPSHSEVLSKRDSGLVRRELDELSKSVSKAGPRVLFVDQGPIVEAIEPILISNGYQVRSLDTTARTWPDPVFKYQPHVAIEVARNFQPHVAMLELLTPVMDGIQLGQALSNILPHAKIVLRTSGDGYGERKKILEYPAKHGYSFEIFDAPFEREELLKKMKLWVHEPSMRDFVTGFYLQNHFLWILDTEIYRSQRYGYEFSLVFFSLIETPERKQTTPPSAQERRLLGELAYRVTSMYRLIDFGFRYGENDFAVLLPQSPKNSAKELAKKLSRLIHETEWQAIAGFPVKLSAKIAVVSFPEDGSTRKDLVLAADYMLSR